MKPSRLRTPAATPGGRRIVRMTSDNDSTSSSGSSATEEVAVFCRLRPVADGEESCVEVVDEVTLRVLPPESSRAFYNGKATQYSFKLVFDEKAEQKTVFHKSAKPLVKDLIQGKNGLLFTYGVTGSGKTYTMQGTPNDGGVMTRSIDVIFNSIGDKLTRTKCMLEPDRLNDFQILSMMDANRKSRADKNTSDIKLPTRLPDETRIEDIDNNCVYAVFISYWELYNKEFYDLLDESRNPVTGKYKFDSKNLREDAHGNMYIQGGIEKEVRSPQDALELFYKGQKRRRVAETQLNLESSRSHSIFNIRLVKCYETDNGEIDPEKGSMVSQMSLVDLAGSERTSRTGNTGNRRREAGNINNSLMYLRMCFEQMRGKQKSGKTEFINYRHDKLTFLFKNFFEGIGSVKMIVNINPRGEDYDETVNVLQFADMAQEVEIERHDPIMRELGMTPARARAHQAYQETLNRPTTNVDPAKLNPTFSPIYSLGPAWPNMEWQGFGDEETLPALQRYLEQRIATRNTLLKDHQDKEEQFRQRLVTMEKEYILLRQENQQLKCGLEGEKRRTKELENRLVNAEAANTSLQRRVEAFCDAKVVLENELDDKEIELNEQRKETKKVVRRLRSQISTEAAIASNDADRRKRSYEDTEFRGVGSRIAEMEAKATRKRSKH